MTENSVQEHQFLVMIGSAAPTFVPLGQDQRGNIIAASMSTMETKSDAFIKI